MRRSVLGTLALLGLLLPAPPVKAGNLNPPGAPAPTMVTLDQINAAIAAATSSAGDAELAAAAAETAAIGAQETRTPIDALPGNANSLHVISAPGSYYFRGDIVGVSGLAGIEVASDFVTIDLNGFELVGVAGSTRGIAYGTSGNRLGLTIRNGRVRGWPNGGITNQGALAIGAILERVICSGNGSAGAVLGVQSIVRDCAFVQNTGQGLGAGGVVVNCLAQGNTSVGFNTSGVTRNCYSFQNQSGGQSSGVIQGCFIDTNTQTGLIHFSGVMTGVYARGNGLDGLALFQGCLVLENDCAFNGASGVGAGIRAQSNNNWIVGNHVADNDNGVDCDAAGNVITRNSAIGNTDNYGQIVGGNAVGPVGTASTSTSPFANIGF